MPYRGFSNKQNTLRGGLTNTFAWGWEGWSTVASLENDWDPGSFGPQPAPVIFLQTSKLFFQTSWRPSGGHQKLLQFLFN